MSTVSQLVRPGKFVFVGLFFLNTSSDPDLVLAAANIALEHNEDAQRAAEKVRKLNPAFKTWEISQSHSRTEIKVTWINW